MYLILKKHTFKATNCYQTKSNQTLFLTRMTVWISNCCYFYIFTAKSDILLEHKTLELIHFVLKSGAANLVKKDHLLYFISVWQSQPIRLNFSDVNLPLCLE